MPLAHFELFEPICCRCNNAAREIEQRGRQRWPTSVSSDQLFDVCGAEPALDLLDGAWLAGRSLAVARSRSSASVSGPGKRFE